MSERDGSGRFQTGSNGGPGRPKGSRNKLSEAFLAALCEDFDAHGAATIVRMRESDPVAYVKVLATILPKQIRVDDDEVHDLTDADLERSIRRLAAEFGFLEPASSPLLIGGEGSDLREGEAA